MILATFIICTLNKHLVLDLEEKLTLKISMPLMCHSLNKVSRQTGTEMGIIFELLTPTFKTE